MLCLSDQEGDMRVPRVVEVARLSHRRAPDGISGVTSAVICAPGILMGGVLSYRYEDNWSVFRLELPIPGSVHTRR